MSEITQSKACQYLYAVIKEADWIDKEYKHFAEKYKKTEKPLIELYLCICDNVSLDVLQLVELNEPVEEAFRECRQKHLESIYTKKYSNDIRKIKHIAAATEKEVKNMSGTVKLLAENIPSFDEMFSHPMDNEKDEVSQEKKGFLKNESKAENDKKEKVEHKSNEYFEKRNYSTNVNKPGKTSFQKFLDKQNSIFSMYKKKSPAKYIETLVKEGYSIEQIDFILDCMEAGDSIREVEEFASPKITVELMKKLRELRKKERGS